MYGTDDSDMKIVGKRLQPIDESDMEAKLYNHERKNGNLEKAHDIGKFFAESLMNEDGFAYEKNRASDFEARNRSILFAFTADRVLSTFMPNHIIARSAQNEFFDEIRRRDIGLYESISRSGAFSMYLLCRRRGDGRYTGVGRVYAGVIRRPDDEATAAKGDEIYEKYFDFCIEHIKNIEFAF
ncbi:MAG: hypothetical protein J6J15_06180 [Oscillospiraceae bacterium]|nr:hypothetical protein [Oscillospiraceae bacterium]